MADGLLGGATDAAGQPTSAVYRARVNDDGTVAAWNATTSLPVALHSLGAAIFQGDLYVVGGSTTGNAPVAPETGLPGTGGTNVGTGSGTSGGVSGGAGLGADGNGGGGTPVDGGTGAGGAIIVVVP